MTRSADKKEISIELLRNQVDQLQIDAAEKSKPWFKKFSNLLSLAAILFSIASFTISQNKASLQEARAKRAELRELLIELIAGEAEHQQLMISKLDLAVKEMESGMINVKQRIHYDAAIYLADDLDEAESITAAEYKILASEAMRISDFGNAMLFFERAAKAAQSPITRSIAFRDLGSFHHASGTPDSRTKAAKHYQKAIEATADGKDDYSLYATGYSYETWGINELIRGYEDDGNAKLAKAKDFYLKITEANPIRETALAGLNKRTDNPDKALYQRLDNE